MLRVTEKKYIVSESYEIVLLCPLMMFGINYDLSCFFKVFGKEMCWSLMVLVLKW